MRKSNVYQDRFRTEVINGATITSSFVASGPPPDREPWFTVHFIGGTLCVYGYDRVEVNGEVIYDAAQDKNSAAPDDGYVRGVGYDPWCGNVSSDHFIRVLSTDYLPRQARDKDRES